MGSIEDYDNIDMKGCTMESTGKGQVSEQLEILKKAVDHLVEQVNRIEERLGLALRTAEEGESKDAVDKSIVPPAETIRAQTYRKKVRRLD